MNFPEQSFNFLLYFPLAVDAGSDDGGTEEENTKSPGGHDALLVCVHFGTLFIVEAAARLVLGLAVAGPVDLHARVVQLVLLGNRLLWLKLVVKTRFL